MDPVTEPPMMSPVRAPRPEEPARFHKRSDLHLARKAWHIVTVSMMAIGYALLPEGISSWVLGVACLAFVSLDYLRQYNDRLNRMLVRAFALFIRDHEVNKWAGTSYLLVGVAISKLCFNFNITMLSLLFHAIADPTASFFGIRYGRHKLLGPKSLEGSLASFVVCAMITYLFCARVGIYTDRLVVLSLLAGAAGSVAELVPVGKLDDNLTFPVLSSILIWAIFTFMNAFTAYPAVW